MQNARTTGASSRQPESAFRSATSTSSRSSAFTNLAIVLLSSTSRVKLRTVGDDGRAPHLMRTVLVNWRGTSASAILASTLDVPERSGERDRSSQRSQFDARGRA